MTSTPGDGINVALLSALPQSRNVLELGCNDGRLGARYKELHPGARWTGVDLNDGALSVAAQRLDAAIRLDLESEPVARAGTAFDLVVMGDVLEHLRRPERVLSALHDVCARGARIVMCMPNMSHTSVLERFLFGDVMYDDAGLLDRTHVRMFSPHAVYKMLLDCGWLPQAAGGYNARHPNERFVSAMIDAAAALGISRAAAEINVNTYQLIISCRAAPPATANAGGPANLSVVVRETNPAQLALNLARSPGLHEMGAEVMAVRDLSSAAEAFAVASERASTEWLMFCGQDVYLPRGSGYAVAELLRAIDPRDAPLAVVGLAGVGVDEQTQAHLAGLVVDGLRLFDGSASERATSIEDYAVLMHRSCAYAIDPELGWDLWATDLCLQAAARGRFARIARVPFYHNGAGDGTLNEPLLISGMYLTDKYPAMPKILTRDWSISRAGGFESAPFAEKAS